MRDHRKLRAFEAADGLVLAIYRWTRAFPSDERFGLTSQLRRAAVSITSNIVEGSARSSEREYLRFIEMSFSSACEVQYQIGLARRLEFGEAQEGEAIEMTSGMVVRFLSKLLQALDPEAEARSPKPEAPALPPSPRGSHVR